MRLLRPATTLLVTALAIAAVTLSACGGSGDSSDSTAAAGSSSGGAVVTIKSFAYKPASLTVAKGSMVEFTNEDSSNHTATSQSTGAFDTGTIGQGQSKPVTLEKAGTFAYFCSFHPFMKGTITVEG